MNSPTETLDAGRMHSGCLRLPTGPELMAGSAETLFVQPCRDHVPLLTGCQMPSLCPHAADWMGSPMGCVAFLEHPPTLEYLEIQEHVTNMYLKQTCQLFTYSTTIKLFKLQVLGVFPYSVNCEIGLIVPDCGYYYD